MLRICLIIAIVAGLAAGVISLVQVRDVMLQTQTDRDTYHKERDDEKTQKVATQKKLAKTETELKSTKETLAGTEVKLKTVTALADSLDKQKTELTSLLETTRADRDLANQELNKWEIVGLKPEQVAGMRADLARTTTERDAYVKENKVMNQKVAELNAKIAGILGPNAQVPLPPSLVGKILAVDEKYQFVVLDVGGEQGVLERGEVLASRNGKLIAKLRIASVQKTNSIANILPGWQKGDLKEGDQIISVLVD